MATMTATLRAQRQTSKRTFRPNWTWTVQIGLAALFLFAGAGKFMMPAGDLTEQSGFSIEFMRFIAAAEVLGGLGLVLPGVLRFQRWLTPLAAIGLSVIMVGAVTVTAADGGVLPALFPAVVGLAALFVMVQRRDWLGQP